MKEVITAEKQKIIWEHCGEYYEDLILWNDHYFCYQGYQRVYEFLDEHTLGIYDEMENTPGIQRKSSTKKYNYLDYEEIINNSLETQKTKPWYSLYKSSHYFPAAVCTKY